MNYWPEVLGKVIANAAFQATLGNLELPSRLLISKLVTTQDDVAIFFSSIQGYITVGILWAIGTTLLMYVMHEYTGAILNLVLQLAAMIWIISRRYNTVVLNVTKYNLKL